MKLKATAHHRNWARRVATWEQRAPGEEVIAMKRVRGTLGRKMRRPMRCRSCYTNIDAGGILRDGHSFCCDECHMDYERNHMI